MAQSELPDRLIVVSSKTFSVVMMRSRAGIVTYRKPRTRPVTQQWKCDVFCWTDNMRS